MEYINRQKIVGQTFGFTYAFQRQPRWTAKNGDSKRRDNGASS